MTAVVARATRTARSHGAAQHRALASAFDSAQRRERLVSDLLARTDAELTAALRAADPADRFVHAHLAALRTAGAVLDASGARPPRGRTRSAWDRLAAEGPELASWAAFFASGAHLRTAVEAGRGDVVDADVAARWVGAAEDFRDAVSAWLESDEPGAGHVTGRQGRLVEAS